MSPDVPTVKVRVLTNDFTCKWISVYVIDIRNQILLTLLTFIALPILRKVSIWCERLLFGVCYYLKV